ncbi:MAG TPA: histidinol phosphate phosphatase domain-containing protein [Anaerolineae bacterium]|nr:histidinol phosphate phosphatase domain-containing protein [Anaerolineae bacterium]HOR00701.1 histidinol phosphate phosphatase domain-containing protein [Anaerolineae bacterium]HPL28430.1 histidinol phosphate phosphatase domain-containing protein [Anaerolineae bacterium]
MEGRIDVHTHTTLSDGDLLPSELLRRAACLGHAVVGLADHVDASNLEMVIAALLHLTAEEGEGYGLIPLVGVELTHVPPRSIARLARQAKAAGAQYVVVHGETIVEPVAPGTNRAAVECPDVDVLAHPGLVTLEEARLAAAHGIYLEISARRGHCLANGHVVAIAREAGAGFLVNTDAHEPRDLLTLEGARRIAQGANLSPAEVEAAVHSHPIALVQRAMERRRQ